MYCPDCGSKNSEDQRFCRACGLGLEKISLSLSEQRPLKTDLTVQQRKEKLEKLGVAALSVFGVSMIGFIAWGIASKLMASQGPFWGILIALAVLIVFGCGLGSVILFAKANELKELPASRESNVQKELPNGRRTNELLSEGKDQPVFSVTDRTTELLSVDRKRVDQ